LTTAELLERAADRIERVGLLHGDYGTAEGPNCAVGALIFEYDPERARHAGLIFEVEREPVVKCAVAALHSAIKTSSLFAWNDSPQRTPEEVAAAMRKAAQLSNNERENELP
jgi:hypothetical protein